MKRFQPEKSGGILSNIHCLLFARFSIVLPHCSFSGCLCPPN
ncbi:hypothetical protein GCWU000324_00162 [Kingella oralis ATCC 51147]|uniref:Uncharacterized protein n=1 Tax=Kingella oralis ATCC 51147 TaxID=629741 RepID=C4GH33_9NEIS|nr:hypothetical protein GCWU000324_00162 [Kingella oralis ATCC 51147]